MYSGRSFFWGPQVLRRPVIRKVTIVKNALKDLGILAAGNVMHKPQVKTATLWVVHWVFKGKSTINDVFSYEIKVFPVKYPLNQSIEWLINAWCVFSRGLGGSQCDIIVFYMFVLQG